MCHFKMYMVVVVVVLTNSAKKDILIARKKTKKKKDKNYNALVVERDCGVLLYISLSFMLGRDVFG